MTRATPGGTSASQSSPSRIAARTSAPEISFSAPSSSTTTSKPAAISRSSFVPPQSENSRRNCVTPSGTYAGQSSGSFTGNGITCARRPSSATTASIISSRSTYENGFDSGRCRSGSDGSSLIRRGSGFVIPTKSSSHRRAAPRRYSRWPLWNGWNRPWIIPRRLLDDDAAPFLDIADPADEEPGRREVGPERRERPDARGGVAVQRPHPADGALELLRPRVALLVAGHYQARPERLRQEECVSGAGAVLRPDPVRPHRADDGEPVLRLGVANRV